MLNSVNLAHRKTIFYWPRIHADLTRIFYEIWVLILLQSWENLH